MPTITTQAGPWNMTVFAYDEADADNPLFRLQAPAVERLPFGALELDGQGRVLRHTDTEPGDAGQGERQSILGQDFFAQTAPWAAGTPIEDTFRSGTGDGPMNTVFDCAPRGGLPFRVRIHLKTSPILGTYWIFIKKLMRG